jgi:hypothetical protein
MRVPALGEASVLEAMNEDLSDALSAIKLMSLKMPLASLDEDGVPTPASRKERRGRVDHFERRQGSVLNGEELLICFARRKLVDTPGTSRCNSRLSE